MGILENKSIAEAEAYVNANSQTLEESVRANLKMPEPTKRDLLFTSRKWTYGIVGGAVGGMILLFLGVILIFLIQTEGDYGASSPAPGGIVVIALGAILFVAAFITLFVRSAAMSDFKKRVLFDQTQAYEAFFAKNFDNLSVSRWSTHEDVVPIRRLRPGPVPGDAIIVNANLGMSGKINELDYVSVWLRWRWQRTRTNGKTTYTETYYYSALGALVTGFNERYNAFQFDMSYPSANLLGKLAFWKRTELEGAEFEKKTAISSNDEVALRRLLTPRTQELILNEINTKAVGHTELHLRNQELVIFRADAHESFSINFAVSSNRDKMVQSFVKDLKADVARAIAFFSQLSNYPTLKKG